MQGVNDAVEDARRLARLLRGLPSKLNLIPMNPHEDCPERPSPPEAVERFAAELARQDVTVTVRRPRGADIAAACGQLALRSAPARPPTPDAPATPCSTQ
jgi:23S rRNA (adenine2503-C2)-methyltransferase